MFSNFFNRAVPEKNEFEMTELHPKTSIPIDTKSTSIEIKPSNTDEKSLQLITAKKKAKTPCEKIQKLFAYHAEVSPPKRIVQTMWAGLTSFDLHNSTLAFYNTVADYFSTQYPPNNPEFVLKFNSIFSECLASTIAVTGFFIAQQGIGNNLKNNVNYKKFMDKFSNDDLEKQKKILLVISRSLDFIHEHNKGKKEHIDFSLEKVANAQESGSLKYATFKQTKITIQNQDEKKLEETAPKSYWQTFKKYINPFYFFPDVSAGQIFFQQIMLSALSSFELNKSALGLVSIILSLSGGAEVSLGIKIASFILVAVPAFFLNQNTIGNSARNSNKYKDLLHKASHYMDEQKNFINNLPQLFVELLNETQTTLDKNAIAAIMAELQNDIKNNKPTPKKEQSYFSWIGENIFSFYPQVPVKKEIVQTCLSALTGYDLHNVFLAFFTALSPKLTGSVFAKTFSVMMGIIGAYTVQNTIGTNLSNSATYKSFIDEFLKDLKIQKERLKIILPILSILIQQTDTLDPNKALLLKELDYVQNFSLNNPLKQKKTKIDDDKSCCNQCKKSVCCCLSGCFEMFSDNVSHNHFTLR